MKKKLIYVIAVFFVGIVLVLLTPSFIKKLNNNIKFIQYEEMKSKIKKEDFFLIISKKTCPECMNLKEKINDEKQITDNVYVFEYKEDRAESLISELESIFPNFVVVPYLCYIRDEKVFVYNGKMSTNEIIEWMNRVR